jgi:hypothetical protein
MHDLFADRMGNISISDGVARLDFMRLETGDDGKPVLKPGVRLVLPASALMQMHAMLEKLREEIAKQSTPPSADSPQH